MNNVLNETTDSLVQDFKINVAGGLVATQEVLSGMKAQGKGTILFTGGGFSLYPNPDLASLSIGKAGIRNLAKMLADVLKSDSIRVGTVTICGTVSVDDPKYNPTSIAENYWAFYTGKVDIPEIIY